MKYLSSLFLLTILAFSFFNFSPVPSSTINNTLQTYCNNRFDFCLDYPMYIFTKHTHSVNSDGIQLESSDGDVIVQVAGSYNILNTTPEQELSYFMQAMTDTYGVIEEKNTIIEDHQFETTLTVGHQMFYQKTVFYNDFVVSLFIQTNIKNLNQPEHFIEVLMDLLEFSIEI